MTEERDHEGSEEHARARQLTAASRVEGISAAEREWLDSHLERCPQCAEEESAVAAAIHSLRAGHVLASAETVRRTRLAVHRRAEELRIERARAVSLWIVLALSAACMLLTTPYTWWTFAWLGRAARLPDPVWQAGFLTWWFLPATVAAAVMAWRHTGEGPRRHAGAQTNWGQV